MRMKIELDEIEVQDMDSEKINFVWYAYMFQKLDSWKLLLLHR